MRDRYHPGASVIVFSVVSDETVDKLVEAINGCIREAKLCESTHAWIMPVETAIHEC